MGSKSRQLQTQKTMPCRDGCHWGMLEAADSCREQMFRCQDPAFAEYNSCLDKCSRLETVYEDRDERLR